MPRRALFKTKIVWREVTAASIETKEHPPPTPKRSPVKGSMNAADRGECRPSLQNIYCCRNVYYPAPYPSLKVKANRLDYVVYTSTCYCTLTFHTFLCKHAAAVVGQTSSDCLDEGLYAGIRIHELHQRVGKLRRGNVVLLNIAGG